MFSLPDLMQLSLRKRQPWLPLLPRLGLLLLLVGHGSVLAQSQSNPLAEDPRARQAGGVIFRAQCATCHGADARGIANIDAPDLTLMWSNRELSEAEVFATIRNGIPGSIMPPHSFPDAEVWMLVSYLQSIAAGGTAHRFTGDASRGRELFSANCATCHRVAGQGGTLGPDLTRITSRRSLPVLTESVRNPSTTIGRGYRPVTIVTQEGERVQGTIKSEDAFSIQIMDLNQQLRGFSKKETTSLNHGNESLMPPFTAAQLSDGDLDNIFTYLQASP